MTTPREAGLKNAERQALSMAKNLAPTCPDEARGYKLLARKLRRARRRIGRPSARHCAA